MGRVKENNETRRGLQGWEGKSNMKQSDSSQEHLVSAGREQGRGEDRDDKGKTGSMRRE